MLWASGGSGFDGIGWIKGESVKTLPYETSTAGDRALAELQRVLEGFGCKQFGTAVDNERQVITVAFRWRDQQVVMDASWKGYAVAWMKKHPLSYRSNMSRQQHEQKALERGRVAVCSVLRDWVKAQTVAIECGVLQFEEVFMPHMMLPNGVRVIDAVKNAKLLPQLGHDG